MTSWARLLGERPSFLRLFLAHSVSRAGDAFNAVALVVLVFRLTGTGLGVAGTVVFEILPILLLGPFVGVLIDRYPRRAIMVAADLARAVLALAMAMFPFVPVAYVVAFGLSVFAQCFNPAVSATIPESVKEDELVDANGALWTVAVVGQILLAPLAGGLVAYFGTGLAFIINSASFLVSAALLVRLPAGSTPATVPRRGWSMVAEGIRVVKRHVLLRRLAAVQVLAAFSAGATSALLVVFASEALEVGASGFGWLLAAIGLGAAVGPIALRRFIHPSERLWLFGPFALRGAVDLVLSAAGSLYVAAPALVLYGVGTSTGMVAYQSTLQRELPDDVRGRAFTLYDVLWNAGRLASIAAGGVLSDAAGIRAVYLLGGLLLFAAFALGVRGLR